MYRYTYITAEITVSLSRKHARFQMYAKLRILLLGI